VDEDEDDEEDGEEGAEVGPVTLPDIASMTVLHSGNAGDMAAATGNTTPTDANSSGSSATGEVPSPATSGGAIAGTKEPSNCYSISTEELITEIGEQSMLTYAQKYFALEQAGLLRRVKIAPEKVLTWQRDLIKAPLRMLPPGESQQKATQVFRNITGYMGDRKSSKTKQQHAEKMLRLALGGSQELKDEMYCQLVKQLFNNPSSQSTLDGYQLMILFLSRFPPSDALKLPLMGFFAEKYRNKTYAPDVAALAEFCLHSCAKTLGTHIVYE
jgi:hypothetical protein